MSMYFLELQASGKQITNPSDIDHSRQLRCLHVRTSNIGHTAWCSKCHYWVCILCQYICIESHVL